jgi:hypothetical protein
LEEKDKESKESKIKTKIKDFIMESIEKDLEDIMNSVRPN